MRTPPLGTRYQYERLPEARHSAAALGNEGVEVLATPVLIGFLEQTCHLLLEPYYEAGERTVGVRVEVDHMAPATLDRPVELSAELLAAEGRRLTFAVAAAQDGRRVMAGRHVRAAVRLSRFAKPRAPKPRAAESKPTPPRLDFWFDVNSPWCTLAAERIGDLARRRKAVLRWRPVHLARLNVRIGGRRPLEENEAFVRWYRQDMQDWGELQGLTLRYHPDFPLRPSRALRACLHAADEGQAEAFVRRLLRAYWSECEDISDLAILEGLGKDTGLDGARIRAAAGDSHHKARLEANLEEAVATGLFGLPSVVADGKIFFGNDRLDLLDRYLGRLALGAGE